MYVYPGGKGQKKGRKVVRGVHLLYCAKRGCLTIFLGLIYTDMYTDPFKILQCRTWFSMRIYNYTVKRPKFDFDPKLRHPYSEFLKHRSSLGSYICDIMQKCKHLPIFFCFWNHIKIGGGIIGFVRFLWCGLLGVDVKFWKTRLYCIFPLWRVNILGCLHSKKVVSKIGLTKIILSK